MNDDKGNDPNDLPYRGSFPGYELGKGLFLAWTNALQQQANIFNDGWGKLVTGKYEMKDFYEAMAKSIDVSTAAFQQWTLAVGLPSSPPWVSVPAATAVPVRIRHPIDNTHHVSATPLTLLGKEKPEILPELKVVQKDEYSVEVSWQRQREFTRGQYVGFVMSDRYSEPLAIVTVLVQ
jgi:hypothetical protein